MAIATCTASLARTKTPRVGIERLASLFRPNLCAFPKQSSLSAPSGLYRLLSAWYSFRYSIHASEKLANAEPTKVNATEDGGLGRS